MKPREVARDRWLVLAVCGERGDCQLMEFLGSRAAGASEAAKMMSRLRWVAANGPSSSGEISKNLGDHIFELKTTSLRVLYFYDEGRVVVCSHGFVKRTQKCPPNERSTAVIRRQRYLMEKKHGELVIVDE
jgi:phage-related protein